MAGIGYVIQTVRRHLINLWLVLFLLFNQAGQIAHAASHLHEQHTHGDSPCSLCVAYAAMDSALPVKALLLQSAKAVLWFPPVRMPVVVLRPPVPQARAPPRFL
jgi:Protein of unknown function (DUF2946)